MRYMVKGKEVRSENAAKPPAAASRWLLNWISRLPSTATVLDFGCGKLRYTIPLARRVRAVTSVDSAIQLGRSQKVGRRVCSIREFVHRYLPNVRVYSADEQQWKRRRYDVILCTNVLSAIPKSNARIDLLRIASACLKPEGIFLITTQFRNTHFAGWKSNPNAQPFLDGYLIVGPKGNSFYGLLDERKLENLCRVVGLDVMKSGRIGETAFVVACCKKEKRGMDRRGINLCVELPSPR